MLWETVALRAGAQENNVAEPRAAIDLLAVAVYVIARDGLPLMPSASSQCGRYQLHGMPTVASKRMRSRRVSL